MSTQGPSKVVAIAGATGGIGKSITEAFAKSGKFELVLFLRKPNPDLVSALQSLLPPNSPPLHSHVVDTTSTSSLLPHFQSHKIDTLISALVSLPTTRNPDPSESYIVAEKALVKAGAKAGYLKRFIPSGWAALVKDDIEQPLLYEDRVKMRQWLKSGGTSDGDSDIATDKELERKIKDGLDWNFFACGMFINYLGSQSPKLKNPYPSSPNSIIPPRKAVATLQELEFIFSLSKMTVTVGGTGNEKIALTTAADVGNFTVAACLLKRKWGKDGEEGIGEFWSEKLSAVEINAIAEKVRGQPIKATYLPLPELDSKLSALKATSPTAVELFWLECQDVLAKGLFGCWENKMMSLLEEEGLGFKPTSTEEFVREWWEGVPATVGTA